MPITITQSRSPQGSQMLRLILASGNAHEKDHGMSGSILGPLVLGNPQIKFAAGLSGTIKNWESAGGVKV